MNEHYPWIITGPADLKPAPAVKASRVVERICDRCGWPSKKRKTCPACYTPLDDEPVTGHANLEQLLYLFILVLFVLLLLRLLGVAL